MKYFLILTLLTFTFSLYSCITYDNAFIRNLTNATATIDVYLLNKSSIKSLPNQVTLANKIVKFKGGYKKYFDNIQNVIWIDTNHFKLEIEPNTTLNLEHMLGSFVNSFPEYDARLTVTVNNKVDTLLNGSNDFRHNLFDYKPIWFGSPVLYFDIK